MLGGNCWGTMPLVWSCKHFSWIQKDFLHFRVNHKKKRKTFEDTSYKSKLGSINNQRKE